jgi:hypothetical protein
MKLYETMDIEQLSELKFKIEKDYHFINNAYSKVKQKSINNNEIDQIFELYNLDLITQGKKFLQHKKTLLTNINIILMKNCNHNWIDDVVETQFSERNICYCNKCFIYK